MKGFISNQYIHLLKYFKAEVINISRRKLKMRKSLTVGGSQSDGSILEGLCRTPDLV